ncbi:MAG: CAP domain-containing protein [Minicystis sp.]
MRRAAILVLVLGLGGCFLRSTPENVPPPGAPNPGQWTPPPQQQPYPQAPPQQPWTAPQPYPQAPPQQPWTAPQPYPQAPPQQQAPSSWPAGWIPQLPAPIAWPATPPAGWPSLPGLPGWPGQAQPVPGPQQPVVPPPAQGADLAQRCVDGINRYRATKGLPALARWMEAEPCAVGEAAEDARSQKAHGSFGRCQEGAQNACPNWPGPADRMIDQCLEMMWAEGPGEFPAHGHYENMVSTRSTKVACGVHTMADGRLWAVQDFR